VRLTVNGKSMAQPLMVRLDPRVKITPEVQEIFTLTAQMEDNAHIAEAAYKDARALVKKIEARPESRATEALLEQLEEMAPPEPVAPAGGGRGGRGGGGGGRGAAAEPAAPANLSTIAGRMVGAVQAMQAAEMPPTAAQLLAVNREQAAYSALMAKWAALKAKASGQAAPTAAAPPAAK
jgi:hypothetical protein